MSSLRNRMLLTLGAGIVACWAVACLGVVAVTSRDATSIWDDRLKSFAVKILQAVPTGKNITPGGPRLKLPMADLTRVEPLHFQIWTTRDGRHELSIRTPDAPVEAMAPSFSMEGFANTRIGGQKWRVYSISDSTGHISVQVGALRRTIDTQMRRKALAVVGMGTLLLLLAGGLMFVAVRRALRPVTAVGAELRGRSEFDLRPLASGSLPIELQPLVDAFNDALARLGHAVQMERRFVDDAAHELRTPLAALQAQTQVALRAETLEEKDGALERLLAIVERSSRLSEQMLDLARLDAGALSLQLAPRSLSMLVRHVASEFEIQAEQAGRKLDLRLTDCLVACDIDAIGILVRNLVENALRHSPVGGRVEIGCDMVERAGVRRARLSVLDDGPGVPESEREAIFKRFHRVAGRGGRGGGIGLSLVARIAQLHQATIETGAGLEGRGFGIHVLFLVSS